MMQNKPQKILLIKLGALGDFIWQTCEMKALRLAYPDAHITLMTAAPFIKIAKQSGLFDDYIIDNRTWRPHDWVRIIHKLAYGGYDMICDIQVQNRTKIKYYTLSRFLAPSDCTWAFEIKGGYRVVNIHKRFPLTWGKATQSDLPMPQCDPTLDFCHGENKNFHLLPPEYVLLIPGCSPDHPYKRWPAESYASLAKSLADEGISTVVLGTSAEEKEINTVCAATNRAVNFCNKASLLDIPDLARRSIAVVGNDTGPLHMASLSGARTVALFCDKTKISVSNLPNVSNLIKENIQDISVQDVMSKLQSILHKAKKSD